MGSKSGASEDPPNNITRLVTIGNSDTEGGWQKAVQRHGGLCGSTRFTVP